MTPKRIALTLQLEVDGRAKNITIDSLRPGDFQMGPMHLLSEYFEPMAEIALHAYGELCAEIQPGVREVLEERESISRRLARIGMI